MKINEHQLWDTMNNLYFIKEYLIENLIEEMPNAFWELLDNSITDVKNIVKAESNMNLPERIKLSGYGETIEFSLTNKREIKYHGKTNTSNESLWRTDRLKDNEVFYETEWGWGVFVDVDKMETVAYDGTEWGGQKIINF